jgi:hypothetical protein
MKAFDRLRASVQLEAPGITNRANSLLVDAFRPPFLVAGTVFTLALALTYCGFRDIDSRFIGDRIMLHGRIIDGSAPTPYRYRVLVPYTAETLRLVGSVALPGEMAFLAAYLLVDGIAFLLSLWCLYALLREWFSEEQSLIGVFLAGISFFVAMRDHAFQPWSYLEPALLALALLAIERGEYGRVAIITAVASLNRETALLLPLAVGTVELGRHGLRAATRAAAPSAIVWVTIYGGLRLARGAAPRERPLIEIFSMNMQPHQLALSLAAWVAFLGLMWYWAASGLRRAPQTVRHAAAIIPVHVGLVIAFGLWIEVRVLTTLLPIIIPLGLSKIFPSSWTETDQAPRGATEGA